MMLSSSKLYEVFATFSFCYSRNKKQVTVHKLIFMEMRTNAVSSQAFFNISLMLRERLLLLKRTHLWLDKVQKGFCMT